ncbi:unnamed protein product [Moneuplotes crassus]|uniref:Uncharacterized protein n=1 Tax=Euplotes crassus TaxID=5936 RepID=A0AAD1XFL6_EUPCR|nr:unnamed protein product [Moneuplotes crassus]
MEILSLEAQIALLKRQLIEKNSRRVITGFKDRLLERESICQLRSSSCCIENLFSNLKN